MPCKAKKDPPLNFSRKLGKELHRFQSKLCRNRCFGTKQCLDSKGLMNVIGFTLVQNLTDFHKDRLSAEQLIACAQKLCLDQFEPLHSCPLPTTEITMHKMLKKTHIRILKLSKSQESTYTFIGLINTNCP